MDINNSFISAVREGSLERVKELISYFNLSYSQAEGYVLLRDAVKNNHTAITKLLLTSGCEVNIKNKKNSHSPLHIAVINGNIEIVEMLLDKGANIDAINQYGRTPLYNAVDNEKVEVTELLLKHRADVNARDSRDQTPLHVAVMTGCLQIVEHLLKHGAYVNCTCISAWGQAGCTPLHIAAEKGSEEIIKFLLSSNAHINAGIKYLTPLHVATKNGHEKVVKLLLDHGANVDAQDKYGHTPLYNATKNKQEKVATLLINYGADVNFKDEVGKTPIFYAIENIDLNITKLLLTNGADINIVSKSNQTPLDVATVGSFYNVHNYDDFHIAKYLKQEIIMLKTANLYVSRKNFLSFDGMNDYQNDCENEVESMKGEKISNTNVSFYDILTKNINKLAIYARNEDIVEILESKDYKKKYPIYSKLINSNFKKGVERKELLEENRFFQFLFNRLPELPHNCTEKVFSYLSDTDLRVLIDVCEHINIPNTDISDVASTFIVKDRHAIATI